MNEHVAVLQGYRGTRHEAETALVVCHDRWSSDPAGGVHSLAYPTAWILLYKTPIDSRAPVECEVDAHPARTSDQRLRRATGTKIPPHNAKCQTSRVETEHCLLSSERLPSTTLGTHYCISLYKIPNHTICTRFVPAWHGCRGSYHEAGGFSLGAETAGSASAQWMGVDSFVHHHLDSCPPQDSSG